MCRKKDRREGGCVLLDPDPTKWNTSALLPKHPVVVEGAVHLEHAVRLAAERRIDEARDELSRIDGSGIRDWYIKHAQVAGLRRVEILLTKSHKPAQWARARLKYPNARAEAAIFERDSYRCGYCGVPVVSGRLMRLFSNVVGPLMFPMGRTNSDTHGAALVYRAVADHIVPHWSGGSTEEHNLVTACYPCNFGKAEFTLEQLQLDRPRRAMTAGWKGLECLGPALQREAIKT